MAVKTVFKRYEMKYLLTEDQLSAMKEGMKGRMDEDEYGSSTIRNIYYDTDSFLLIRRSIEKPMYKEKLRTRCYARPENDSPIFIELKKKYDGVVYKRRIALTEREVSAWTGTGTAPNVRHDGTFEEISFFIRRYGHISPKMFISYDRNAFFSPKEDLRMTFDRNILWRTEDLSLDSEIYGSNVLPDGLTLMEIKTSMGLPMWLVSILSKNRIYKSSFSKYGTAYMQMVSGQSYVPDISADTDMPGKGDCTVKGHNLYAMQMLFKTDKGERGIL